jgi:hypothetical protein
MRVHREIKRVRLECLPLQAMFDVGYFPPNTPPE